MTIRITDLIQQGDAVQVHDLLTFRIIAVQRHHRNEQQRFDKSDIIEIVARADDQIIEQRFDDRSGPHV